MAPKRKKPLSDNARYPPLSTLLERPFCWHCNRDFVDVRVLLDHQREYHYRCPVDGCRNRHTNAESCRGHMKFVHNLDFTKIPNALPGRDDPGKPTFAMENVPQEVIDERNERVTREYYLQAQRYMTEHGKPMPNSVPQKLQESQQPVSKKPKIETPKETKEELLARTKAHIAKRKAELAARAQAEAKVKAKAETKTKAEAAAKLEAETKAKAKAKSDAEAEVKANEQVVEDTLKLDTLANTTSANANATSSFPTDLPFCPAGPSTVNDQDSVTQLIEDLSSADKQQEYRMAREQAERQQATSATVTPAPVTPAAPAAAAEKPRVFMKLTLRGAEISWEEMRASLPKFKKA